MNDTTPIKKGPAEILIEKINKGELLVCQANWEDVFDSSININRYLATKHCLASWQEILHMLLCDIDNFDYRIDALNYMIDHGAQWFTKRGYEPKGYALFSGSCLCLIHFYRQLKQIVFNDENLRIYLSGNKFQEDYFKYEFEVVLSNMAPEDLVAYSQVVGSELARTSKFPNIITALLSIRDFRGKIVANDTIAFLKILYHILNMIAFYEKYHDLPKGTPIDQEILVGFKNVSLEKRIKYFQTYWQALYVKKEKELKEDVERNNLPTKEEVALAIYEKEKKEFERALEESKDPNNKNWQYNGAPDVIKMYEYFVHFAYDQCKINEPKANQIIFNGDNTSFYDIHNNENVKIK